MSKELKPVASVFFEDGFPRSGLLADYWTDPETAELEEDEDLVRLQGISEWLEEKKEEIKNREHGEISYKDESLVDSIFYLLQHELSEVSSDE